jgi:glucose-1-phosphate thymidylyltransferase
MSKIMLFQLKKSQKIQNQTMQLVGVYIYDDTVMEKIKTLKPSARGEYEVTDLNNLYIEEGMCKNVTLSGWWIDAGTPERIIELESKLT